MIAGHAFVQNLRRCHCGAVALADRKIKARLTGDLCSTS
jgi:hypothetical protein